MMWGPLVQSFGGCINPVKHTKYHNWRACVVCREDDKIDQGCFGPSGNFRSYCSYRSFQVETWVILFALRGIWKRVVFRFALTSRKFHDLGWSDGRTWHSLIYRCITMAEGTL